MKTLITLTLLTVLMFVGCDQSSEITSPQTELPNQQWKVKSVYNSSEESDDRDPRLHREDLITDESKYPPGADSVFLILDLPTSIPPQLIASDVIDGLVGGIMEIDSEYDGVKILATLEFPDSSFDGVEQITMLLRNDIGIVQFYPEMVFSKPALLSVKYTNIDVSLIPDDIDFIFQDYDGSIEQINYEKLHVGRGPSKYLNLKKAELHHFSRFGWVR